MALECWHCCRVRDFLLQHDRPEDFVRSVLFTSPLPYAVAMTCVSIHTLTMAVYSGFSSTYQEKILIWLTYWSFFTLTARFLLTTFNAWTYIHGQKKKSRCRASVQLEGSGSSSMDPGRKREEECCEMPVLYKVQWILQNVSSSSALIVSGLYWVVLYDPNKPESARSINSHLINFLLVLADLLLSRAPVRLHHFIHALCYIILYVIFTLVYWAAGGTNDLGYPYIYSLLDYTHRPGRAVGVVLAVSLVGTPLSQLLLYLLFRLRQWLRVRCCLRREETASPAVTGDVKVSSLSLGSGKSVTTNCTRQSGENISLDDVSGQKLRDFGGRDYTLPSNKEEGDVMIDVDMDFEMDEVTTGAFRPPLLTNSSQLSCTDSVEALLT